MAASSRKSTPSSGNLRTRQKEERRTHILKAAIAVMATKGYHQTRISDIAEEAGVAYGLVYHYFGSKDKILSAVFESIWERFSKRIEQITAHNLTAEQKLVMIAMYMLDTYIARPDLIRLLVREVVRAQNIEDLEDLEIVKRIIGMIEAICRQGVELGELDADADPRLHALMFFGSVEMVLQGLSSNLYTAPKGAREVRLIKQKVKAFLLGGSFRKTD